MIKVLNDKYKRELDENRTEEILNYVKESQKRKVKKWARCEFINNTVYFALKNYSGSENKTTYLHILRELKSHSKEFKEFTLQNLQMKLNDFQKPVLRGKPNKYYLPGLVVVGRPFQKSSIFIAQSETEIQEAYNNRKINLGYRIKSNELKNQGLLVYKEQLKLQHQQQELLESKEKKQEVY